MLTYGVRVRAVLVVLGLCVAPAAYADSLALDFTSFSPIYCATSPGCVVGWGFEVTSPITVTALGVWDFAGDGFEDPDGTHQVGIFDGSGALLTSTVVLDGSTLLASSTTAGDWRVESITPITLTPETYTIAAFYLPHSGVGGDFGDLFTFRQPSGLTTIPDITWLYPTIGFSSSLQFPTQTGNVEGVFGPTFLVSNDGGLPAPIPEPATLTLLGTGLVGALARATRRRSSQASLPSPVEPPSPE